MMMTTNFVFSGTNGFYQLPVTSLKVIKTCANDAINFKLGEIVFFSITIFLQSMFHKQYIR